VGLSNVNRRQLDEALDLVPVAAVQVALGPFDEQALRGGVVERCAESGIAVVAHTPLGGPRRAGGLARRDALASAASAHGATAAEVALAWLLGLSPAVVAIPGARRPETARSAARAATLELDDAERAAIGGARPAVASRRRVSDGEVVLVMGIPGAGKSRLAEDWVARGYLRLNRDERAGSLRELAGALDEQLSSGVRRLVLDNTYLTRASRSYAIDAAGRHGVAVRCVWLDTPLAQAQVNLVERLLDHFGSLPAPEALRDAARREPGLLAPTSQMRTLRALEPPSEDEGFDTVEHVPFERVRTEGRAGVFVAAAALRRAGWEHALDPQARDAPHLVFDWSPGGSVDTVAADAGRLASAVAGPVESAVCPHPAGPPTCWCRPPLPGLPLAFARMFGLDPSRSTLIGIGPAHKTLTRTIGARYVAV
jgi:predicted kinase